jgi:predicted nucleic acid-binding protein
MKKSLVAIDSGCLIALHSGEKLANEIKENLRDKWEGYCSEMTILETFYVLCRKSNLKTANEKVDALIESNVLHIVPIKKLLKEASKLKCQRSIAIADCLTIALAKRFKGKAIFYRKERELKKSINKKPFQVELMFLIDED